MKLFYYIFESVDKIAKNFLKVSITKHLLALQ